MASIGGLLRVEELGGEIDHDHRQATVELSRSLSSQRQTRMSFTFALKSSSGSVVVFFLASGRSGVRYCSESAFRAGHPDFFQNLAMAGFKVVGGEVAVQLLSAGVRSRRTTAMLLANFSRASS